MATPTPYDQTPPQGTPEHRWWRQGAADEAFYETRGMTQDGREFYEFVQTLAQRGDAPSKMLNYLVLVYGPTRLKDRLKLIKEMFK